MVKPPDAVETQATGAAYAAGARAERAQREVPAAFPPPVTLDDIRIASPSWNDKLLRITAAIADAVSGVEVYEAIVDHVAEAVGATSAALWLLEDDGIAVRRVRRRGEAAANLPKDNAALGLDGASPPAPVLDAIRLGEPVWIGSQAAPGDRHPHWAGGTAAQVEAHISCLPLVTRGRPVGALSLVMGQTSVAAGEMATHKSREEQQFLLLVARYASQALERLHLYQESVGARSRAEELYRFAETVVAAERIDTVFEAALAAMEPALGATRASILTIGKDGVMRFRAWRNLSSEYRSAVDGHSPWAADVATAPAPLLVPDVECDPVNPEYLPIFRQHDIRALAFFPLFASRLLGKFMVYYDQPHAFSSHDIEMARAIANQLTSVIIRFAVRDELEETTRLLNGVLEAAPVAIWAKDGSGRYLFANPIAASNLHRSASEVVGHADHKIVAPLAASPLDERDKLVLSTGETQSLEEVDESGDHASAFLTVRFPIRGLDGVPRAVGGVAMDISERRRAEAEAQRLAAIVDATPDLVGISRPDGRAVYLNPAARRMLGIDEDKMNRSGHDYRRAWPSWVSARMTQKWIPAAVRDGSVTDEAVLLSATGTEIPVSFVMLTHRNGAGELEYISTIARDVSEQKALERELKARMKELAATDRRKDEFLATLAHELRNPLAPLRNSLELLHLGESDAAVIQRVRGIMDRQLGHLVRLVDDLLDVARITSGKLQLRSERVALKSVVDTAVEASRPHIDNARHALTVSISDNDIYLDADPTRLAQVLSNLLTNAAKYTDAGGHIRLSAERAGDAVTIRVSDNGLGIPSDHLPRIFEMFSQVTPALDRAQGGLGIGLALVKGIVGLHGGTVSAASDGAGRGSTFTVRLPLAAAKSTALTVGPPDAAVSSRHRILIVDDNTDSADTLAAVLKLHGNEVRTAYNGSAAMAAAQSFRPSAVLLDLGMAPINGYEVCHQIREQPWGRGMFIVAMTGWGQDDDRRRTQEAGFDAHLVKPLDSALLLRLFAEGVPTATG